MPHSIPRLTKADTKSVGTAAAARGLTKKAQLIKLMSRRSGAGVEAISVKFGWQSHTTRAALSRLRIANFDMTKDTGGASKLIRYRIARSSSAQSTETTSND